MMTALITDIFCMKWTMSFTPRDLRWAGGFWWVAWVFLITGPVAFYIVMDMHHENIDKFAFYTIPPVSELLLWLYNYN